MATRAEIVRYLTTTPENINIMIIMQMIDSYKCSPSEFSAFIHVSYPKGYTCICSKDDIVYTALDDKGEYTFIVEEPGEWTVEIRNKNGEIINSGTATITSPSEATDLVLLYTQWKYAQNHKWGDVKGITWLDMKQGELP